MTPSINPTLSIFDETFTKDRCSDYKLFIQVSDTMLVYCVFNRLTNKFIGFEKYNLEQSNESIPFEQTILAILEQKPFLSHSFDSVKTIVNSNHTVFVPVSLFDETQKENLFSFNHTLKSDELLLTDNAPNIGAKIISSVIEYIPRFIQKIFPASSIISLSAALTEELFVLYKNKNTSQNAFVHIQQKQFEILIFAENKLLFFNSFQYKTSEDCLYYILFTLEQMQMNPEQTTLILSGEIEKQSSIYDYLHKYIQFITFAARNESYYYSYRFDSFPFHYYQILFNLNLCE